MSSVTSKSWLAGLASVLWIFSGCAQPSDPETGRPGDSSPAPEEDPSSSSATAPTSAPPEKIAWLDSYEEARKAAQGQKKPLLVFFHAPW